MSKKCECRTEDAGCTHEIIFLECYVQHQFLVVNQDSQSRTIKADFELPAMRSNYTRASSYVKENDLKFGVSVSSRVMHTGTVHGLRCRFCVSFGRELNKVGTKRKTSQVSAQTWSVPFRYDNIENHVRTQHPAKWSEYDEAKKQWNYASRFEECNKFFDEVISTSRSNFWSPAGKAGKTSEQPLMFPIDKNIIEVIIGEMMYSPTSTGDGCVNDVDSSNSHEELEDNASSLFCSVAEQLAVASDRRVLAARSKEAALSLFERVDDNAVMPVGNDATVAGNNEELESSYKYMATISIPLLFDLAVRYISCGTSFRMAASIMRQTVDVFGSHRALNRLEVSRMMRVTCAANLQTISDLLINSWTFSIAIDSATHHSTSYLDIQFRVYSREHTTIFNFHGCAIPMHERHTGEVMCAMICKFLSVLCPHWQVIAWCGV